MPHWVPDLSLGSKISMKPFSISFFFSELDTINEPSTSLPLQPRTLPPFSFTFMHNTLVVSCFVDTVLARYWLSFTPTSSLSGANILTCFRQLAFESNSSKICKRNIKTSRQRHPQPPTPIHVGTVVQLMHNSSKKTNKIMNMFGNNTWTTGKKKLFLPT